MTTPAFPGFDYKDAASVHRRLLESLPPLHRRALEVVTSVAGPGVYLVGGIVRDFLLGRSNLDLDFVCLAPASQTVAELLPGLRAEFGAEALKVMYYEGFGTVRLDIGPTLHLDFATARHETYSQPAALPTVSFPATLEQDLRRRDFSFNALALAADGQFYDPFDGLTDLRDGWLRVLHELSFVDDPTRMIRGVRFAARMGYRFEPTTEQLLKEALAGGYFERLSAERKRNELRLILREKLPQRGLALLDHYGLLAAIHPTLSWNDSLQAQFDCLSGDAVELDWNAWLAVLLHHTVAEATSRLLNDLRFDRAESTLPVEVARLWQTVRPALAPGLKNSQLYDLFHSYGSESLVILRLLLPEESQREAVTCYLDQVAGRKPILTGDDLIRLGVSPGPAMKTLLARLRSAVLDGEASGAAAETAFIRRLIEVG